MTETATVVVRRGGIVDATYEVGKYDYDNDEEFNRKREQIRKLLEQVTWEG